MAEWNLQNSIIGVSLKFMFTLGTQLYNDFRKTGLLSRRKIICRCGMNTEALRETEKTLSVCTSTENRKVDEGVIRTYGLIELQPKVDWH